MDLSENQKRILNYIRHSYNEKELIPTVREIQVACGISSTSVVDYNLDRLVLAGLLKRRDGKSRSIAIVGEPTRRELKAEISRLRAENEQLKSNKGVEYGKAKVAR